MDDSTRRICAAVYYDQQKAHEVLDLVGGRDFAYVAQHDGIDTALVVAHAAASLKMWRRHNLVVMLIAISPLILIGIAARSILSIIVALPLVLVSLLVVGMVVKILAKVKRAERSPFTWFILMGSGVLLWWVVLPVLGAVAVVFSLSLFMLALPATLGLAADFFQRVWIHSNKLREFKVDTWTTEFPDVSDPDLKALIAELSKSSMSANATVYSGYVPFVGAGLEMVRWNEALELQPVDSSSKPASSNGDVAAATDISEFDISAELTDYFRSIELPGSQVRRWHFVHGHSARSVPGMFGPSSMRPTGVADERMVADGRLSDEVVRPYIWIDGRRWGGDVILNTFIRLDPRPSTVFVEIGHYVVTPVDRKFERCDYAFDSIQWTLWRGMRNESWHGLLTWAESVRWGMTRTSRWRSASQEARRLEAQKFEVDHGAISSVRDLFSSTTFDHYFQQMDEAEHRKSINVHLLAGISRSLKSKGLEIARLETVAQSLTQNVTITDSSIQAHNFNAGWGNAIGDNGSSRADATSASSAGGGSADAT